MEIILMTEQQLSICFSCKRSCQTEFTEQILDAKKGTQFLKTQTLKPLTKFFSAKESEFLQGMVDLVCLHRKAQVLKRNRLFTGKVYLTRKKRKDGRHKGLGRLETRMLIMTKRQLRFSAPVALAARSSCSSRKAFALPFHSFIP